MHAGEELAWEQLGLIDPEVVCRRSLALFNHASHAFELKFFSHYVNVSLNNKLISGRVREGELLLEKLSNYANLAILWYLIYVSDTPPSGKLINPADLAGGQIYAGGTHVLPVQMIADKYHTDREVFIINGKTLGGRELGLAEASVLLTPFPRFTVAVLLWLKDDEFQARSVLLVDSAAGKQLPPDAIWLTAMMCLMALL